MQNEQDRHLQYDCARTHTHKGMGRRVRSTGIGNGGWVGSPWDYTMMRRLLEAAPLAALCDASVMRLRRRAGLASAEHRQPSPRLAHTTGQSCEPLLGTLWRRDAVVDTWIGDRLRRYSCTQLSRNLGECCTTVVPYCLLYEYIALPRFLTYFGPFEGSQTNCAG